MTRIESEVQTWLIDCAWVKLFQVLAGASGASLMDSCRMFLRLYRIAWKETP